MARRTRKQHLDDRGGAPLKTKEGSVKFPVDVHKSPSTARKVATVGL
jgi:hypothetical protein